MSRLNLFKFLKEYNEIKHPVTRDIREYKFSLLMGKINPSEYIEVFSTNDDSITEVLTVRKPITLSCPTPPEALRSWIQTGWDDISVTEIQVIPSIETPNPEGETALIERFSDNQSRVVAFQKWKEARQNWRIKEIPKQDAYNLYSKLYALHSEIKKEAENIELVLGDGNLYWKNYPHDYHHPLVTQKVELFFDSSVPKFVVYVDEPKVELNAAIIRSIQGLDQSIIYDLTETIDEIGSIFDTKFNNERFKELIARLDTNGTFEDGPIANHKHPIIYSEPVLYLRKKTQGYSQFISNILDVISEDEEAKLPDFFENLIGNFIDVPPLPRENNWNPSGLDQDILLTLPANNEQLGILKKLKHYPAVLVQGPPGTGKTHTIANLIGHLLSEGNNVLVTSHTEKALAVLKQKVHKDLQNLCISLLSSSSQRAEMEKALNEINEKRSTFNEFESQAKIERLTKERATLIDMYKTKFAELTRVRGSEYVDLIYNDETVKPIDAAKYIGEGSQQLDIIPGESTNDQIALPVTVTELQELYESNKRISAEDEYLLSKQWPDIDKLWTPSNFRTRVDLVNELQQKAENTEKTNPLIIEQINKIRETRELFMELRHLTAELDEETHVILSDY
jgi:hypothetical protein